MSTKDSDDVKSLNKFEKNKFIVLVGYIQELINWLKKMK